MFTRDSVLWWLLIVGSVLTYLSNAPAPSTWTWAQWMQALSAVVGIIAAKLATSPLKGDKDTPAVNPSRWVGMFLIAAFMLPVAGCGGKTKPILIKTDAAVYEAVKAIHDTAVVLGKSGVITPAQELRIQEALLPVSRLGEQATRVIAAWKLGPTPPELQRLIRELGTLVQEIGRIVPGEAAGKAALLQAIATAQQAVLVVLAITGRA